MAEPQDVQLAHLGFAATAGLALLVGAALGTAAWLVAGRPPEVRPAAEFPAPRLQADPERELAALRRRQEALLSEAAWVDRPQGLVRIPIERAMELLAERGLPARGIE